MKLFFYSIISGAMLLSACQTGSKLSVDKRKYRNGYYVSFNKPDKPAPVCKDAAIALPQQEVKLSCLNDVYDSAGLITSGIGAADSATGFDSNKQPEVFSPPKEQMFTTELFVVNPVTENTTYQAKVVRPQIKKRYSHGLLHAAPAADDKEDKRLLCIILALFFPAVALYIYEGNSRNFKISLLIGLLALGCLALSYVFIFALIPIAATLFRLLFASLFLINKIFAVVKIAKSK